jgi:hypothetical protein
MSVFDRMYLGRMGSWSFNSIRLLIATDVSFDFLLRGGRTGMSAVENEDDLPPDAAAANDEDA